MSNVLRIGVDIGGSQIRAAVVDDGGSIVDRCAMATPAQEGPEAVTEIVRRTVAKVRSGLTIHHIGVACPGPLDSRSGVTLGIATMHGFENYPLARNLSAALGQDVSLLHDGAAAAYGEWRFGAGRGCTTVAYITVSTGIGGAVITDGKVLTGRRGLAAHVGHIGLVRDGVMCGCGRRGCWEAYGAGPALAKRASMANASLVFDAAERGVASAKSIIEDYARILGEGIVNVLHAYDPDIVVLGGGVMQRFDQIKTAMLLHVRSQAMPAFRDIPIVRAERIGDSGLIGAAALSSPQF